MLYIETDFGYRVGYPSVKSRILLPQTTYQSIVKSVIVYASSVTLRALVPS
jgi:hypothetical protein